MPPARARSWSTRRPTRSTPRSATRSSSSTAPRTPSEGVRGAVDDDDLVAERGVDLVGRLVDHERARAGGMAGGRERGAAAVGGVDNADRPARILAGHVRLARARV